MRLTCPACGAEFTLDVLIAHDGAREALVEAMGMNLTMGKRLVQYLALFRPAERQLTMDRVAKILREIAPAIKAAQIERHGRVYVVPKESWEWALDEIVAKKDKLSLPLKSHGYLFEMLIGAADRLEAAAETAKENRRRGATPIGSVIQGPAPPPPAPPTGGTLPPTETAPRGSQPEEFRNVLQGLRRKHRGGINGEK